MNYTKEQLMYLEKVDLRAIAEDLQIKLRSNASKETIVYAILDYQAAQLTRIDNAELFSQQTKSTKKELVAIEETPISNSLFDEVEVHEPEEDASDVISSLEILEEAEPDDVINPILEEEKTTGYVIPDDVVFIITEDIPLLDEIVYDTPLISDERFSPSQLIAKMGLSDASYLAVDSDEDDIAVNEEFLSKEVKNYSFDDILVGSGLLEIMPDGVGYLRSADYSYMPSPDDIYVSAQHIKQHALKNGDVIEGAIRVPNEGEKYYPLMSVSKINGLDPLQVRHRLPFEHLTPLFPEEKFKLCNGQNDSLSCRIVDLFTPIGKGQRALIVAQPKTGKTLLMKDLANAIARNNPETYLIMLLIDERPEEVTDMERTVNAEVIASTFDEPASRHVKIAGIVLEKAKRLVESGQDVVIFLDSITRLARAYNTVSPASGKVLSGGVDANALQKPKRFFGAARNIEGGGSLTIIATALIDTGSKMDEVIFEEFKGTGNMELQLDRSLSNKRMFPAVNTLMSSTRRDDLLHDPQTQSYMWKLRKYMSEMTPSESLTLIKNGLANTQTNEEYLHSFVSSLPLD